MLRIAICEDDAPSRITMEQMVRAWERAQRQSASLRLFSCAEELLAELDEGERFDAVFLDIHLRRINGMEAAQVIRLRDRELLLVFVTNHMDYVLRGYEVGALRYLIKPVKQHDVNACLDSIAAALRFRAERGYLLRCEGQEISVRYEEILYFEVFSHTVSMHLLGRKPLVFSKRISEIEKELPPFFVRCHRSYVVNIYHVYAVKKGVVELNSSLELPVSQRRREALHKAFLQFRC